MSNKPHEVMAQVVVEFSRILLRELAEKYGGDCTLNELRVMNQIIRCSLEGRTCAVTALHNITGIPTPTVSRSVAHLRSEGWLSEQPDPDDGRKRIISLGPRSLEVTWDDINRRVQWFNDFRKHGLST